MRITPVFAVFFLFAFLLQPFISIAETHTLNKALDSMLSRLPHAAEDTNKVILLDRISYAYVDADPEKGINYAMQAKLLAEKLDWKKGIAMANSELGGNYKSKSDLVKSTQYYLEAINKFREIGRDKGVASVMANLSVVYLEQGDYNEALKYAFGSLKIKESMKDTKSMGIVQENIGTIYLELKNYDKTMEFYTKALATYKATANLTGEVRCLGNIALVYEVRKDFKNALNYHFKALETKQKMGDEFAVSVTYSNLGNVYTEKENYDKALFYHTKALEITRKVGNKSAIALTYANMGETYLRLAQEKAYMRYRNALIPKTKDGNIDLSLKCLNTAMKLCQETNFKRPVLMVSENLFKAYMLKGDHEKSLQVFDQYIKIKDSVFSQQNLQQLANQEAKRELELKDKDIIITNKKLEITALKAENASKQRQVLLAGIIVLMAVGGMVYTRFRNRIKKQDTALDDISQIQSHQVRGPVARILGLVQLFNDKEISDPINKEVITHLKTSTDQLDKVVKRLIITADA